MKKELKEIIELTAERNEAMKKVAHTVIDMFEKSDLSIPEKALCLKYLSETFHKTFRINIEVIKIPQEIDKSQVD